MNICLAIRTLTIGGAQLQCIQIARALKARGHSVVVVVFYPGGELESDVGLVGIDVVSLQKHGRWNLIDPIRRYLAMVRSRRIDVVYSLLPMENLVSLLVARRAGIPIVWGLRAAGVDRWQFGLSSRILYALQSALLRLPNGVISNSHAAMTENAIEISSTRCVIPNGVDTQRFFQSPDLRVAMRTRLSVGPNDKLIGIVARLDPIKNHAEFLEAAKLLSDSRSDVKFVIAGSGSDEYARTLRETSVRLGIENRISWLGSVQAPETVYNALDVIVSSSIGEGLPNAILEAMACGVFPVVTDVGDSSRAIGEFGTVVPCGQPAKMALAINVALMHDCDEFRKTRVAYVGRNYEIRNAVESTERTLRFVAGSNHGTVLG
jgi:glycosyltransferase involved in cell wall biosynthesis